MQMKQDFNRRFSPNRRKTRVKATLEAEGEAFAVVILDVSYRGLKLSVPHAFTPGTPVFIRLPGAGLRAIIHWSRDGLAGARLLDRLDRDVLIALETADDDLADFR